MAALNHIGTLVLHIHAAEHLRDVQTFGKQDPYVVVKCGKEKYKTRVCENGGRNPNWEVSFCFNLDGSDNTLRFKLKDQEITKDREIARADIPLQQLLHPNGRKSISLVAVNNFSKSAGILWISTTFTAGVGGYSQEYTNEYQKSLVSNVSNLGNAHTIAIATPVQQQYVHPQRIVVVQPMYPSAYVSNQQAIQPPTPQSYNHTPIPASGYVPSQQPALVRPYDTPLPASGYALSQQTAAPVQPFNDGSSFSNGYARSTIGQNWSNPPTGPVVHTGVYPKLR